MSVFSTSDKQQTYALARCKAPEMQPLLQLFQKALEDTKTSLVRVDDTEHFRRLQGRAQVLNDFLSAVEYAASNMERP